MKSKNSAFFISLFKVLIIISILIDSRAIAQADIETITLSKALEIAMENNPTVNASEHQLEAAQSKVWEAKSNYLPSITASAGYTLHEEPNIIVPIHERGMFPPLDEQIYETIFQLSMPLFNGGRTGANTQAAHASLTESKAQQDLVKINLLESIGQVFLQAMQLNDNQRLIRARIQSLLQRHREMKLLLKEGRVSTSDLALLNSSIEAARSDSIELDNQQLELSYRLGQLLGLKKALQPNVVNLSKEKATANRSIPDSADIAGPMVTRSIAQLNRAEALKHLASRNFWPEVRGFASYNLRSGAELDMIGEWAVGLTLRIPLFEGGRRIANVQAARASVRAAEENLRSAEQEQSNRLQIAKNQWQSAKTRRQYIQKAVDNKTRSVSAQQELYQTGRVSLSDMLVQETELLELQLEKRSLAYSEILAVLNYHATAGTLTQNKVKTIVGSLP